MLSHFFWLCSFIASLSAKCSIIYFHSSTCHYSTGKWIQIITLSPFQPFCTSFFIQLRSYLQSSLILRRESCSFNNGEYVNAGLAELKQWLSNSSVVSTSHPCVHFLQFSIIFTQIFLAYSVQAELGMNWSNYAGSWYPGKTLLLTSYGYATYNWRLMPFGICGKVVLQCSLNTMLYIA